jgi:hypothetical protein
MNRSIYMSITVTNKNNQTWSPTNHGMYMNMYVRVHAYAYVCIYNYTYVCTFNTYIS